jgi:mitochondrial import inner membrane translocase, subunit TIM44, putative
LEEAQKSELGRKSAEVSEEIAKQARAAAEVISKQRQSLGSNTAFKAVSQVFDWLFKA